MGRRTGEPLLFFLLTGEGLECCAVITWQPNVPTTTGRLFARLTARATRSVGVLGGRARAHLLVVHLVVTDDISLKLVRICRGLSCPQYFSPVTSVIVCYSVLASSSAAALCGTAGSGCCANVPIFSRPQILLPSI